MIDVDLSELDAVADLLRTAPDQARAAAYQAGVTVGADVKAGAQADAPRDRPWLAVSGIAKRSWRDQRGSHTDIYTTSDPRGRNVGFYVENGTTDTPPNPFLSSQMGWAGQKFPDQIVENVDPLARPMPVADDLG